VSSIKESHCQKGGFGLKWRISEVRDDCRILLIERFLAS
jgi:hypothetical protein